MFKMGVFLVNKPFFKQLKEECVLCCVIPIEDSAELQITGIPNLVRLEARNANVEGTGGINIRDLIRTALRMRPERIIVGEVRGEEALDMLQAFICTI